MLESLSSAGVSCTYIMINSLSYVMKEVCTPRVVPCSLSCLRAWLPVLCACTCRRGRSERVMRVWLSHLVFHAQRSLRWRGKRSRAL